MWKKFIASIALGAALCSLPLFMITAQATPKVQIQFLATSDTHGKFLPYDYARNKESKKGSLAQVATAIEKLRTANTIVVDGGDIIQDNSSDIFLKDELHPMILAMNDIHYDIWVTGNHEYNFGMATLERIIKQNKAQLLCGNVYNPQGKRLAPAYTIVERGGVKIGIIGMVTPNITRWDQKNLEGWKVTSPLEETRAAIKALQGKVDLLVAINHMDMENEYSVAASGVKDIALACPELNLIIASHGHQVLSGEKVNGVPIIENKKHANTLGQVLMDLEKTEKGWRLLNTVAQIIPMKSYAPSAKLQKELQPYHARAIKEAETPIGEMVDTALAPANLYLGDDHIAKLTPTALSTFINAVQLHYAKNAKVAACPIINNAANARRGVLRKCDIANIYAYDNTLYTIEMTGAQLRRYMEWTAGAFNQYHSGDLTLSYNPHMRGYNYQVFAGVKYEINVAKPIGQRIQNLTWLDGRPVKDEEVFLLAVNNYHGNTALCNYGPVFHKGEALPKVKEIDVAGNIGNVRALIIDYIQHVLGGKLNATCQDNWRIVGNNWDPKLHQEAVAALRAGKLKVTNTHDNRTLNIKSITVSDLQKLK